MSNPNIWRCRIGNIRPKAGGATVRLLDGRHDLQCLEVKDHFYKEGSSAIEGFDRPAGYALVVWSLDGGCRVAHNIHDASKVQMPTLASFVRDQVAAASAWDVAHEAIDFRLFNSDGED